LCDLRVGGVNFRRLQEAIDTTNSGENVSRRLSEGERVARRLSKNSTSDAVSRCQRTTYFK